MRIVGSGTAVAPVVYVEDLADFTIHVAESKAAVGQIFNICSGERVTWKQFFTTLAEYLKKPLPRTHVPARLLYPAAAILEAVWKLVRAGDPPPATRFGVNLYTSEASYDISKAQKVLGFRPQVFHREGLRRTVDWIKQEDSEVWSSQQVVGVPVHH
jgi:nucleoside-diphosphate-sugar epimerase